MLLRGVSKSGGYNNKKRNTHTYFTPTTHAFGGVISGGHSRDGTAGLLAIGVSSENPARYKPFPTHPYRLLPNLSLIHI